MNTQKLSLASLRPAWLWFWLTLYLIGLPNLFQDQFVKRINDISSSTYTWSVQVGGLTPLFETMRAVSLYELVAYVVVFVGVASVFLPWLRGAYVEKKYRLIQADTIPVVHEIGIFVRQQVPNIYIRANLRRTDLFAITYPLGFRKPALAIFGGLVILWRMDQKRAEAILLHEIGHVRQGDTLILGAGSLFEVLVRYWVWIFLFLIFLPVTLYTAGSIYQYSRQFSGFLENVPGHFVLVTANLIILGVMTLISEFFMMFSVFVLPLAGIWSAELYADRFVIDTTQSDQAIKNGLANLDRKSIWKKEILSGASHPPARFRAFLTNHYRSKVMIPVLVLFFPLAYFVKFLFLLVATLLPQFYDRSTLANNFSLAVQSTIDGLLPLLFAMIVWVLIWPLITAAWLWFFTQKRYTLAWTKQKIFSVCVAVPLLIVIWKGCVPTSSDSPKVNIVASQTPTTTIQKEQLTPVSTTQQTGGAKEQTTSANTPNGFYKIGQIVPAGNFRLIVLGYEILSDDPALQGQQNKVLVRIRVTFWNEGITDNSNLASSILIRDASNKEYSFSLNPDINSWVIEPDSPTESIKPGERFQGTVAYLVDKTSQGLVFEFISNPPLDMTRSFIPLTDDPDGRVSTPDVFPTITAVTAARLPATLAVDGINITSHRVWVVDLQNFPPKDGNRYLAIDMTFLCTGKTNFEIANIYSILLLDENGHNYLPSAVLTGIIAAQQHKNLPDKNLSPGQKVDVTIGFMVPKTIKALTLQYSFGENKQAIDLPIP